MIRVVLFGAGGRMGRLVIDTLSNESDIEIAAGVESPDHPAIRSGINGQKIYPDGDKLPEADVWFDFSLAEPAVRHAGQAADMTIPLVIAATGISASDMNKLKLYSQRCPILFAPNLSIGIAVLDRLAGEAAAILGSEFDAAIVETHHKTKLDQPSGTALKLADSIRSGGLEPQVSSLRLGGAIGEHTVSFVGSDEELIITHRAFSRRAFSRGVARAVRFIHNKSVGLYTIRDMFAEV